MQINSDWSFTISMLSDWSWGLGRKAAGLKGPTVITVSPLFKGVARHYAIDICLHWAFTAAALCYHDNKCSNQCSHAEVSIKDHLAWSYCDFCKEFQRTYSRKGLPSWDYPWQWLFRFFTLVHQPNFSSVVQRWSALFCVRINRLIVSCSRLLLSLLSYRGSQRNLCKGPEWWISAHQSSDWKWWDDHFTHHSRVQNFFF